jgi:ornithine carbamoyltransferase
LKHFINILDYSSEELKKILQISLDLKKRMKKGIPDQHMVGKRLMTIFEKPSTRTRVSLESAVVSLGGHAITQELSGDNRIGKREAPKDVAQVLSRYVDVIAIRTFAHSIVEEMAEYSSVPVINALSDQSHPTQVMADLLTMQEHMENIEGKKFVFVGDGNNVSRSLASVCGKLGVEFALCCPEGYEFDDEFMGYLRKSCPNVKFTLGNDIKEVVQGADVVYTDVWASMGQEDEGKIREKAFAPYQVNSDLMKHANDNCLVMHCLPAHRGHEITDDVIDSKTSVVFDEAENRMHIYRGLFVYLLSQ